MNTINSKTDLTADKLNLCSVLDESINKDCTYGFEYVIDELFPQVKRDVSRHIPISWSGLDDLII